MASFSAPVCLLASVIDSAELLNARIKVITMSMKSTMQDLSAEELLKNLQMLQVLVRLPSEASASGSAVEKVGFCLSEESACVLAEVCLPSIQGEVMTKENASCVVDILSGIFHLLPLNVRSDILKLCCQTLENYVSEQSATYFKAEPTLVAMLALDLLSNCCADLLASDWNTRVFSVVEEILVKGEGRVACHAINSLLPLLKDHAHFPHLWRCVHSVFHAHGSDDSCSQALLLLCALADLFFPQSGLPGPIAKLLTEDSFWEVLQCGLFSLSPLTRKRASYLVKRIMDVLHTHQVSINPTSDNALFKWDATLKREYSILWDAVVLVAETLEEKQTHVIRPVLTSRLKDVLLTAALKSPCEGTASLHMTWVTSLLVRMSHHESLHIKEWAVKFTLTMQLNFDHLNNPRILQFLLGPFTKMLTDSKVYHSPSVERAEGFLPMDRALPFFFTRCHSVLSGPHRKKFFEDFLKGMSEEFWSGSCLVFIMQALSQLPDEAVVGPEALPCIRELLTTSCSTVELHIRGALHCFFLHAIMRMIDPETIGPGDFAGVLSVISSAEALQRGELLWKETTQWMQRVSASHEAWSKDALLKYSKQSCASFVQCAKPSSVELCRIVLLTCDADLVQESELQLILGPVAELIASAGSRVYMDANRVNRALVLFSTLLCEMRHFDDACSAQVLEMLRGCVDSFMAFVMRQLTELEEVAHMTGISQQVSFLIALLSVESMRTAVWECAHTHTFLKSCVASLLAEQTTVLRQQLNKHASLLFLVALSERAPPSVFQHLKETLFKQWLPVPNFLKPHDWVDKDSSSEDLQLGLTWGKLSSAHVTQQWALFEFHLRLEGVVNVTADCIDACLCTLDILSPEALLPLLKCLRHLLHKMPEETQLRILQLTFIALTEHVQNLSFWSLLDAFLSLILTEHHSSRLQLASDEWLRQLMDLGQEKSGLANMLVRHLERCLLESPQISLIPWLLESTVFGPVHSKGRRFANEVHQYLLALGDAVPTNRLRDGFARSDNMVRAQSLTLIAKLATQSQNKSLLQELLQGLMQRLLDQQELSRFKNFTNSLSHREKHRIVCSFFFFEPVIDKDFMQLCFSEFLWCALKAESQPSVRVYFEWLIARLMLRHPSMQGHMWDVISQPSSEKRAGYFSSVLCILSHVSKMLDTPKHEQELFYERAFPVVMPWCMAHHFNLRVYAQACLLSLWQNCSQRKLDSVLNKFQLIQHYAHQQCMATGDHARNLLQNFTCLLDPKSDISVETLVHTLPRLCDISEAEWLSIDLFERHDTAFWQGTTSPIPLRNPTSDLAQCQQGLWKAKMYKGENEVATATAAGDIQKKIVPWQSMIPEQDLEMESRKQVKRGGLVLVTSLIDKVPNLGGLCRTSEIFGVSEFVIGNIGYTKDRVFESLSVTAEKWIPITEVPIFKLASYLESMRRNGFTLVGAEQTAQSVCLTSYTFPEKTLLLLGNEKEGIPVELIQMLDVCVEIPQQGLIRSLNVHVSGALLIWEYTRQRLMASASS